MLLSGGPVLAHSAKVGAIEIGHLWAKPPANGTLEVTGPLFNTGSAPDRLIAASSPAAAEVRFETKADGKVAPVDSIELPPGRPVSLAPWRQRLVIEGLKTTPAAGGTVPLTLTFERAGKADCEVMIERSPSD